MEVLAPPLSPSAVLLSVAESRAKMLAINCRCRGGGSDGAAISMRSEFVTTVTMCGGDHGGGDATLGRDGL